MVRGTAGGVPRLWLSPNTTVVCFQLSLQCGGMCLALVVTSFSKAVSASEGLFNAARASVARHAMTKACGMHAHAGIRDVLHVSPYPLLVWGSENLCHPPLFSA